MKLLSKQKEIIQVIRNTGVYLVSNFQNPTVQKLLSLGLVDYNRAFDGLILTELGKTIEL